jgi:hypothetical protein
MNCPGCGAAMHALDFEASLPNRVTIDFCFDCRVIWFDAHESTELSPGGVLEVFKALDANRSAKPARLPALSRPVGADPGPAAYNALQLLSLHLGSRAAYAISAVPSRKEFHPAGVRHRAGRPQGQGAKPFNAPTAVPRSTSSTTPLALTATRRFPFSTRTRYRRPCASWPTPKHTGRPSTSLRWPMPCFSGHRRIGVPASRATAWSKIWSRPASVS